MARLVLALLTSLAGSLLALPVLLLGFPFWLMSADTANPAGRFSTVTR